MGLTDRAAEQYVREFAASGLEQATINLDKTFHLRTDQDPNQWATKVGDYLSTSIFGNKVGVRVDAGHVVLFKKGGKR